MKKSLILIFVMLLALFASTVMYAQETAVSQPEIVRETESLESEESEDVVVEEVQLTDSDAADTADETEEEPQMVEEPQVVEEPQATEEPLVVEETQVTEEPQVVEEPQATEEPKVVEEPQATEEPQVVEEPQTTEEPKVVEEPQAAKEPQVVEEPKATEEPEQNVEPETAGSEESTSTETVKENEEVKTEENGQEETEQKEEKTEEPSSVTDEPKTGEETIEEETAGYITVTVSGAQGVFVYDGEAHSVDGFSIEVSCGEMDGCGYSYGDFTFIGEAVAERTEFGRSEMGLSADQFINNKEDMDVRFVVIDGFVEITANYEVIDETGNNYENEDNDPNTADVVMPGNHTGDKPILSIHLAPTETPDDELDETVDDIWVEDLEEGLTEDIDTEDMGDETAEDTDIEDMDDEAAEDIDSEDIDDEAAEDTDSEDLDKEETEDTDADNMDEEKAEDDVTDEENKEETDEDIDEEDEESTETDEETDEDDVDAEAISAILAEYGIEGEPEVAAVKAETAIRVDADGMSVIVLSPEEDLELIILGTEGDWVRVLLPDHTIGYIFYEDLEEEPAPKVYTAKKVTIFTDLGLIVEEGSSINLTSLLEGFEDCTSVSYQWECDRGDGFEPVEGGNGESYSYPATAETLNWSWHLVVSYK